MIQTINNMISSSNHKSYWSSFIMLQVLERTLQSTNSTQYSHLIDKLFSQEGSRVSEFSYFLDAQENKRSLQDVKKVDVIVQLSIAYL